MNLALDLTGLRIDSALINHHRANFVPSMWPPARDFPVVIDANNKVICRYGEATWDLSIWAEHALRLNFGDGKTRGKRVNRPNADLLRAVIGRWLWGPNAVSNPRTLRGRHEVLKPIFVACTEAGILASGLYRYPKIIEKAARRIGKSKGSEAISLLHQVWMDRESLGFTILDEQGLKQFSGLVTERESTQTAYIPARIWSYKALRLKECLDDFIKHQKQVEACYTFCLQAYLKNANDYTHELYRHRIRAADAPFNRQKSPASNCDSRGFYGTFRITAERFGIYELLDRWVNASDSSGIKALSSYLSLVSKVGLAYVLSFSLMRADEGNGLRANCYEIERDSLGDDIHLIRGVTTKTVNDGQACWIVSPSVQVAIQAMTSVAKLRLKAAKQDPDVALSDEDIRNPVLQSWAYEPWAASTRTKSPRKRVVDLSVVIKAWPKLFDSTALTITKEDLDVARQVTIGLDPARFAVGKEWPLAWHQDRRTGAVNMLSTGLVSESSLQYQLKHASVAMSRYYGQNHYKLKGHFDEETRGLYLREMYQTVARQFEDLHKDTYVSPYGEKHKAQILKPLNQLTHEKLVRAGKSGDIAYHETLLGGCAKPGLPCPFGGISNISNCVGYGSKKKPCEFALIRADRKPRIIATRDMLIVRRQMAEPNSMLSESLDAQIDAAQRALEIIDGE